MYPRILIYKATIQKVQMNFEHKKNLNSLRSIPMGIFLCMSQAETATLVAT